MSIVEIIGLLESKNFGPKRSGDGWASCCPAHDDANPSLSISEGTDGRVLLYCHAGCTLDEITDSLEITVKDLFPAKPSKNATKGRMVQAYDYHDASGILIYQVC